MAVNEQLIAKKMAKALAFLCLNEHLQTPLHNGEQPVSKTGDYSDVFITDAEGRQIVWCQACRVSCKERERVFDDVAKGIYDFLLNIETDFYTRRLERAYRACVHWKKEGLKKKTKRRI